MGQTKLMMVSLDGLSLIYTSLHQTSQSPSSYADVLAWMPINAGRITAPMLEAQNTLV